MIKTRAIIEVEVKGRSAYLECPTEFTWEDVVQALMFLNAIAQEKIKAIQEQQTKEEITEKTEEVNVD